MDQLTLLSLAVGVLGVVTWLAVTRLRKRVNVLEHLVKDLLGHDDDPVDDWKAGRPYDEE